jgi:hypothetical protein
MPEQTYRQLREQAERAGTPATTLARQAIDWWLRQQLRKARHDAIAAYAAEAAGTSFDLDPELDRAKLTRKIGALPPESLREVEDGLKAAMDLD